MNSTLIDNETLEAAIRAIQDSFESIRKREVDRHHHRFAGIDRNELDRITRAITQKLLAVPIERLEAIDPERSDLERGIEHMHTVFSQTGCDDECGALIVEQDMQQDLHILPSIPDALHRTELQNQSA